jgi:hypothetical protein
MQVRTLKELLPSLKSDGREVTCSLEDFLKLIPPALLPPIVDEDWYLSCYPDVREAIKQGFVRSASEHFYTYGILEGRLPENPIVDEAWYIRNNPDVGESVEKAKLKSGWEHYVRYGSREGRSPRP